MSIPAEPATFELLVESARAAERAGEWDDALERYTSALTHADAGAADRAAELHRWSGQVHLRRGHYDLALDAFRRSLEAAERGGLAAQRAAAMNCMAAVEQCRGGMDEAESLFLEARALAGEAGDERLAAMVEQNLGMLAAIRGELETALVRYRSALDAYERLGDDLAAAWAVHNMGMAHVDLEEWDRARACYERAWELAERVQDVATLGNIELNRGELCLKEGDLAAAREHCERAAEIYGRLQSRKPLGEVHKLRGVLHQRAGDAGAAAAHLAAAAEIARECGDPLLEAETEYELALMHIAEGRNREALDSLSRAHTLFTAVQARRDLLGVDRRLRRLEETYLLVVKAWGESIESKDHYTAGHCERVAEYACRLAEAVGFGRQDLAWFRMGAFLHDVGKTAIPEEVLNKPGKLTAEEWGLMQRHTTAGDQIISQLDFPWDIRPMVRNHHERWDGTGYPDGLKGEEIPLPARILCIADTYDALTTTRSYRPAHSQDEALRIMEDEAGRVLDPHLFTLFQDLV